MLAGSPPAEAGARSIEKEGDRRRQRIREVAEGVAVEERRTDERISRRLCRRPSKVPRIVQAEIAELPCHENEADGDDERQNEPQPVGEPQGLTAR